MSQQVNENIAASKRAGATGAGPAPLGSKNAGARLGVFATIAVAWVVLDQVVKAALNTACSGTVLSGPIAG
ncbi:hypothetical protein, partial [uncultured Senegalimassilia sp.]|uniref:hypothetical protein n=1 Tax=uncultured Senegalimassilia sp. TaxID=1714350 RepID=UPI0025833083